MVIHAIPVQQSFDFLVENKDYIPEGIPYIIASTGILLKQKTFFSDIWGDIFGSKKVTHMILSGPTFAIEIMKQYPSLAVLGTKDIERGKFVQENLSNNEFKLLYTEDVKGVEIGEALKNRLAIGAGLMEGQGYSYNSISGLVTRGIYELSLFSKKFGGKQETLFGLSGKNIYNKGIGDVR